MKKLVCAISIVLCSCLLSVNAETDIGLIVDKYIASKSNAVINYHTEPLLIKISFNDEFNHAILSTVDFSYLKDDVHDVHDGIRLPSIFSELRTDINSAELAGYSTFEVGWRNQYNL